MGPGAGKKLAVVIPVYDEEENVPELCDRLAAVGEGLEGMDWEVLFVDDGSSDRTVELILARREQEPRFKLVRLSRNFGHQPAISAGLAHADADAVVVLDADMQDPPELIPELLAAWRQGAHVVLAKRSSRQERSLLRRMGFAVFHRFFGALSDFPIATNTGVFGLMDRSVVAELNALTERNRFLPGLRSWVGFTQATVTYDRQDRAAGAPKQTVRRLARYAMDGVFSFSFKPLRLMTGAGFLVSLAGFAVAVFFIVKRLVGAETAGTGFTTLVSLILFLGGIQLMALGLLGEYLGRIYDEVKNRPLYIVRDRHGLGETTE